MKVLFLFWSAEDLCLGSSPPILSMLELFAFEYNMPLRLKLRTMQGQQKPSLQPLLNKTATRDSKVMSGQGHLRRTEVPTATEGLHQNIRTIQGHIQTHSMEGTFKEALRAMWRQYARDLPFGVLMALPFSAAAGGVKGN